MKIKEVTRQMKKISLVLFLALLILSPSQSDLIGINNGDNVDINNVGKEGSNEEKT